MISTASGGKARGVGAAPLAPLALAAAAIHAWAAAEHAGESAWIAGAFGALAGAQAVLGCRLLRPVARRLLVIAAAASAGVALLWLATRTVAVPLLPATPEPVGLPDLGATLLELALVAGAVATCSGLRLDRGGMLCWGVSAGLATTLFAGGHGDAGSTFAGLHPLFHLGPVVAAFAVFASVVARRAGAGSLAFSRALRPSPPRRSS